MADFLQNRLKLTLHPEKIFIKTLAQGMDFLGWVHFFDHMVLRTKTKQRMFQKMGKNQKPEVVNSYLGLLKHGNAYQLAKSINLSL